MSNRAEVVVVGGGPAGSATAWGLARNGVDVTLVDRARFPRAKACAEYLNPRALRLVEGMGLLATMERAADGPVDSLRVHTHDGEWFEGQFSELPAAPGMRRYGLGVRREILDTALLNAARDAGARVLEETTVQDVLLDAAGAACGVTVHANGEQRQIRAAHIVGADGLRSAVARRLGLARHHWWPTRSAFVQHFTGVTTAHRGERHVFDDGYCGISPVGGGVTNVTVVAPAQRAPDAAVDAADCFNAWIAGHPELAERMARAHPAGELLVTGPFASRSHRAWARSASLVGDAADFFDPFTGEGICSALRGAEMLVPYLVDSLRATPARAHEALEAYDRCRHHEFRAKWRLERLVGLAVSWPQLLTGVGARMRADRTLAAALVGATGGLVPAREVVSVRFAARFFGMIAT